MDFFDDMCVHVDSFLEKNDHSDVNNWGACMCRGKGYIEKSLGFSSQFYCKLKIALKKKRVF